MSSVRLYIIAAGLLMVVGVGFGIYIWYVLQSVSREAGTGEPAYREVQEDDPALHKVNEGNASDGPGARSFDSLTTEERTLLAAFGGTGNAEVVTEGVVECGRVAVGETRFTEIVEGSAPNPLEAAKLTRCVEAR